MLIDEQYIVLEARVKMGLQAKLSYDVVVVTVDVCVDSVEPLKKLPN